MKKMVDMTSKRLAAILNGRGELLRFDKDLTKVHEHHWQYVNPVTTEALVQLVLGAVFYFWGLRDADSWRLANAKQQTEEGYAKNKPAGGYKGCDTFKDFREVLARKDIDAVLLALSPTSSNPSSLVSTCTLPVAGVSLKTMASICSSSSG